MLSNPAPQEVRLWYATNPEARDFRVETLGRQYQSIGLEPDADGLYTASVRRPEVGWTAYFVELTYDVGAATLLKLTTPVRVTPDELPFADKAPDLPPTVTLVCSVEGEQNVANELAIQATAYAAGEDLNLQGLRTETSGKRVYLNWTPEGRFQEITGALTKFLEERACGAFAYQLESGEKITLPPRS